MTGAKRHDLIVKTSVVITIVAAGIVVAGLLPRDYETTEASAEQNSGEQVVHTAGAVGVPHPTERTPGHRSVHRRRGFRIAHRDTRSARAVGRRRPRCPGAGAYGRVAVTQQGRNAATRTSAVRAGLAAAVAALTVAVAVAILIIDDNRTAAAPDGEIGVTP